MKILIAEDDLMTAKLIEFKFRQQGYDVILAGDGEMALQLVTNERPDLVVLDGMMPHLDGFEVLRKVKESPILKEIPVIMLTARRKDEDVITGLELGASDYIIKPFSPGELVARVKKILSQKK